MAAWVYILLCSDGSYYTGVSTQIETRLNQHHDGKIGYTARRKPVELLWSQEFAHVDDAYAAEKQIKGWTRAKKEALMRGDWDTVRLLARNRQTDK